MTATKQLRDEHEGIKLMLAILERVTRVAGSGHKWDLDHIERMLEFFRVFVDRCHHGKEEDLLFPELEKHGILKNGGPIGVMLSEHVQGRKYIQGMADALVGLHRGAPESATLFGQNAIGYASLLRQHISKEEDVLFTMADKILSSQEDETLLQGFEKLEVERIGVGKHEEFHKLLHKLQDIYLKQQ
ncbi:MAG TPA: hemerythrin domain-containing protein [Thermodesulfobacteriota bacterium]|nr:hemerythrin domain-containing protein [Thermodesulfobacteriota bacterium]